MNVTVRRIFANEGPALKSIRLEALRDSPSAFGSTYVEEVSEPDEHWARRASVGAGSEISATYFAVVDDRVVGLVGGYRLDSSDRSVELVSMWVSPAIRRVGIAGKLVDAVVEWATEIGVSCVDLWVTRGNDAALKLYGAAGFSETGEHQPLPSDPCKDELRMRRVSR
jgi:ribosomal protein S18 acetylase RimI-like enzyme